MPPLKGGYLLLVSSYLLKWGKTREEESVFIISKFSSHFLAVLLTATKASKRCLWRETSIEVIFLKRLPMK